MTSHDSNGQASSGADVETDIAHDFSASKRARQAMAQTSGTGDFFQDVQSVTSELVSNVVRHTDDGGTLRAWDGDRLRVEVSDKSTTLPVANPDQQEGGRGLAIVALRSSEWGSHVSATGKVVWATFDRPTE